MSRESRWCAALLIALFTLASCSSGEDGAGDSALSQTGADSEAPETDDDAAGMQSDAVEEQTADQPENDVADTDRQVVTTASAVVEVDDTRDASSEVIDRITSVGGHVESREERTDDDGRPTHASLTVRVPAEDLSAVIEGLEDVGDVADLTETARDVTGTVRDLDARIEALETSADRLIEILAEADTAEELLQVETTLSERQADLESLQAERNALGDQVSMSTLHLTLSTEPVTEVQADGFVGGLQTGWNGLVGFVNAVLVLTGAALPWLAVIAVPAVVIFVLIRRRVRRRRTGPMSSVPVAAEPGPGQGDGAPVDESADQSSSSGPRA